MKPFVRVISAYKIIFTLPIYLCLHILVRWWGKWKGQHSLVSIVTGVMKGKPEEYGTWRQRRKVTTKTQISCKNVKHDQIARLYKVICQRVHTGSLQRGNINVSHGAVIGKPCYQTPAQGKGMAITQAQSLWRPAKGFCRAVLTGPMWTITANMLNSKV